MEGPIGMSQTEQKFQQLSVDFSFSFNIAQDPDITTQQSGTTLSENSMITLKGMFYMSFDVLMPRNLTLQLFICL